MSMCTVADANVEKNYGRARDSSDQETKGKTRIALIEIGASGTPNPTKKRLEVVSRDLHMCYASLAEWKSGKKEEMHTQTPPAISDTILELCRMIVPGVEPRFLDITESDGYTPQIVLKTSVSGLKN